MGSPVRGGNGEGILPSHGVWGGDELSLVGEPMRDVAGQVSGTAQLLDVPLCDGGGHPRTWALELEFAEMDKPRRKKAQVKGLDLYPLIWVDGNMRPHRPDKTRLSPNRAAINGAVGLPTFVLMGIPE